MGFCSAHLGGRLSRWVTGHGALFATGAIVAAALLSACVTARWLFAADGRKIADDPGLLRQGKSDMATCSADLDNGAPFGRVLRWRGARNGQA